MKIFDYAISEASVRRKRAMMEARFVKARGYTGDVVRQWVHIAKKASADIREAKRLRRGALADIVIPRFEEESACP